MSIDLMRAVFVPLCKVPYKLVLLLEVEAPCVYFAGAVSTNN
jgi:hypothetical protein